MPQKALTLKSQRHVVSDSGLLLPASSKIALIFLTTLFHFVISQFGKGEDLSEIIFDETLDQTDSVFKGIQSPITLGVIDNHKLVLDYSDSGSTVFSSTELLIESSQFQAGIASIKFASLEKFGDDRGAQIILPNPEVQGLVTTLGTCNDHIEFVGHTHYLIEASQIYSDCSIVADGSLLGKRTPYI